MHKKKEQLGGLKNISLKATALLLSSIAISGCGGCLGRGVTEREARQEAVDKYQDAYNRASPAGKFVLQYLRSTEVAIRKYPDQSPVGWIHPNESATYLVKINNGCLKKTAYDVAGGSIRGSFNGLFSSGSVSGDVPSAAAYAQIDPRDKDSLIIQSGHTNSQDLRFTGLEEGNKLLPADDQTENILDTYGCESGLIGIEEWDSSYGIESSAYIE